MAKVRVRIPKTTRDAVMAEFNHRCAICGSGRPQIHHIDEDPSNNDLMNLIPLCPNCHLIDQHNPTKSLEPDKLSLFREFKDPTILKPQFHPLFIRMRFLNAIEFIADPNELVRMSWELADFVAALKMGSFYSKRIIHLLNWDRLPTGAVSNDPEANARFRYVDEHLDRNYREHLREVRNQVISLVIELLRFQEWPTQPNNSFNPTPR